MSHVDNYLRNEPEITSRFIPHAIEAAWQAQQWPKLDSYLEQSRSLRPNYDYELGRALDAIRRHDSDAMSASISTAQQLLVEKLTPSVTTSLRACRDLLVKMHALSEIHDIT